MKPYRRTVLKTTLLATLLCLFASTPALAEQLTLDESVAAAVARQPGLQAIQTDARAAELQAKVARKGYLPALDLEGGYLRSTDKDGAPDFVANNGPNETRAQLVVR